MQRKQIREAIELPQPHYTGKISVEEALLKRRSVREYKNEPLTIQELSQLLWSAQGITDSRGFRSAPSAGALYPLEVYAVCSLVDGLEPGIYKYHPESHSLIKVIAGEKRAELARACFGQLWIQKSAAIIVFSAVYERTTQRYGDRGIFYVHMEAGHAAENLSLQAVALHLGTVVVGAFDDQEVKKIMHLPNSEEPLCLMPVGR